MYLKCYRRYILANVFEIQNTAKYLYFQNKIHTHSHWWKFLRALLKIWVIIALCVWSSWNIF